MKTIKKFHIETSIWKTEEEQEARKQSIIEDMQKTLKAIKQGKIYAKVNSVSRSGMSRKISFYRVYKNEILNITREIAWLSGNATPGDYRQGNSQKYLVDEGLNVQGCGMDMIFHTLYNCMRYSQAKKWNQNYRTL